MAIKGRMKGRSLTTYQNKLRSTKLFYQKTFKNSIKQKTNDTTINSDTQPRKNYFCDKYPSEALFLKKVTLKQSNTKK